jgi:uncharacterized protein
MSPTVNDLLDPWKAAGSNRLIRLEIGLDSFPRLTDLLLDSKGSIRAELEFSFNDARLPSVSGSLKGELTIQCQRCLEAMKIPVDQSLDLSFVRVGQGDQELSEHYDLYEVEDQALRPADMIEDELLLLIPQVPMHTNPECIIETEFGEQIEQQSEERENPFAVLASLKKTDA